MGAQFERKSVDVPHNYAVVRLRVKLFEERYQKSAVGDRDVTTHKFRTR